MKRCIRWRQATRLVRVMGRFHFGVLMQERQNAIHISDPFTCIMSIQHTNFSISVLPKSAPRMEKLWGKPEIM